MPQQIFIAGPVGKIELFVDLPDNAQGIALIAHPHPLFGGTADNKVVTSIARAFRDLNCITVRPSFRGVGSSDGTHDHGIAETDDLLAVVKWMRESYDSGSKLPLYLAGFSFGAFVITRLAKVLAESGAPAKRLVLVGTAAGFVTGARSYTTEAVAKDTLVIHGDKDETVHLSNVLAWAEPLDIPVVVVPGADHFFHRRLHLIREIIIRALR
ncbi:MAG: alpha/beta hydrolase [Rhodocyclaceae bacterium]|nr:alpha/beta hydrolase [Rhodocyclaceae bacterium]